MERYLMYLRKSRMDTDFEEVSIAETLSRHRTTLEKFCKSKRLNVVEVLEEVVSGESLAARPQMMRLLELVSTGSYAGVVCMDIERLSRGSSMESGYIMQILQVNGCKIVTPGKTYDLQNESDEQFTDMKFMFSRYELNHHQTAGTGQKSVRVRRQIHGVNGTLRLPGIQTPRRKGKQPDDRPGGSQGGTDDF